MHFKRLLLKKKEHLEMRRLIEIKNMIVEINFFTGLKDKV